MDSTDKNQEISNEDQSTQNEYIITINKKIRALKKKCQNIGNIEKKVANKESINTDQQKVLDSKEQIIKSLTEFEGIRNQFVEIDNNEQKAPKEKPKHQEIKNESHDIRALVTLFHLTQVFDRNRPDGIDARKAFFNEFSSKQSVTKTDEDVDNLFYMLQALWRNPLPKAVEVAQKFTASVDEEFNLGLTYKHLRNIANEMASSFYFRTVANPDQKGEQQEEAHALPHEAQPDQHAVAQEQIQTENVVSEQLDHQDNNVQVEHGHHGEEVSQEQSGETGEQDDGYQTTERKGRGGRRPFGSRGGPRGAPRGRGGRGGGRGGRERDDRNSPRDDRNSPRDDRNSPRDGRKFESRPPRDKKFETRGGRGQQ